jgi:hypothetical protein
VGASGEHAGWAVAQVAGTSPVVKPSLLGPVQIEPYVALGEVAPLGLDRRSDGGDRAGDVPARTHRRDDDSASRTPASPTPVGAGSCSAGSLLYALLNYFLGFGMCFSPSSRLGIATSTIISSRGVH